MLAMKLTLNSLGFNFFRHHCVESPGDTAMLVQLVPRSGVHTDKGHAQTAIMPSGDARALRRRLLLIVGAPLLALPMLLIEREKPAIGRTAWATAVMAVFWATECLPMAVTSLLPLVVFPLLGVVEADVISRNYFKDKIVLFFGGTRRRRIIAPFTRR